MIISSNAPRPVKASEVEKVVIKKQKKENKISQQKENKAPLTEDELINKIIKGEG